MDNKPMVRKKYMFKITELDINILLEALGDLEHKRENTHERTRPVQIVTQKVYRAMGVRI